MSPAAASRREDDDDDWVDPATVVNRAYSILTIKAVDDDLRMLTGVATTPEPDRLGDVIEPMGVKYKNPMPLLWQHRSSEPVGTVNFDKPTKNGITFRAKIAKTDEPGTLKDRLDEAWQSVKLGLVRAVSIGFRSIEMSFMDDGIRFIESEVLELSLVTIPANSDCRIETIKSIDAEQLAASGQELKGVEGRDGKGSLDGVEPKTAKLIEKIPAASGQAKTPPGDTGKSKRILTSPKEAKKMTKHMTVAEQISAFENTRAAKDARMNELMGKAAEEGVTLEEAESEEYDGLELDIKKIDEHLRRLNALQESNKAAAKPVTAKDPVQASEARRGGGVVSVKANVPPGMPLVRYAIAMMAAKGNRTEALQIAREMRDWHNTPEVELALSTDVQSYVKAVVNPGTSTDSTWAAPLVAYNVMASEFIEYLRPLTIIGRMPGLRRVPFNIQMPRQTGGSSTGWVGEAAVKPVSSLTFDTVTLRWAKAAAIVVLTEELVRFSNPSAEAVVREDMANASAEFLDRQFVDPSVAVVTNVSPASITNGVTAVAASGTTAAAFRADVKSLWANFITANLSTVGGVWIMHSTTALSLSLMQNSLGQEVFPNLTADGGRLLGYPVVVSQNIPGTGGSPTDGYPIIFAIAPQIMLADDGQVTIDASREASLQLDSAPDSPPTASTNMVSLWQTNHVGLRAERYINWVKRRSTAVQYISNAKYSE